MVIHSEVVWSIFSAIVVGVILKFSEYLMQRKADKMEDQQATIRSYHESLEDQLNDLREENRQLRLEVDRYRKLYYELLDRK